MRLKVLWGCLKGGYVSICFVLLLLFICEVISSQDGAA